MTQQTSVRARLAALLAGPDADLYRPIAERLERFAAEPYGDDPAGQHRMVMDLVAITAEIAAADRVMSARVRQGW